MGRQAMVYHRTCGGKLRRCPHHCATVLVGALAAFSSSPGFAGHNCTGLNHARAPSRFSIIFSCHGNTYLIHARTDPVPPLLTKSPFLMTQRQRP